MAKEMTMEELEATFSKIADQRIAAAKAISETEVEKVKAEEAKKADFRAAAFEVLDAAGQKAEAYGQKASTPLELIGKYIMCGAKSANMDPNIKTANKQMAFEAAKTMYPEDKALLGLLKKDMEVGIPSSGGYGIPQILAPDGIRALYATSILDRVGASKVPMPNGNFRWTRMDTSASAGWVGEIPGADKTQPVFGEVNLNAKKLYAISLMSNSLLRYNSVGLESWVVEDLARRASIALDVAALYGTGTLGSPLGLSSSGTGTKTPTSSPGLIPAAQLIATAALSVTSPIDTAVIIEQADVPMLRPAWVMAPTVKSWLMGKAFSTGPFAWSAEMAMQKTLNGSPFVSSSSSYYTSSATATGDLWFGDWSEFIWGVGYDINLEISRDASFVYGGTTYSAFQRDETMVRLIAEHDFGVKHTAAFVCQSVTKA